MIAHSQTATSQPPKRGRKKTMSPAAISTTPAPSIIVCVGSGDSRAMSGDTSSVPIHQQVKELVGSRRDTGRE